MMEYSEYEDMIAAMIGDNASSMPDADDEFTANPDITRAFVMYRGSSWDAPEVNDSAYQEEVMQFDIFVFGLCRRADILPFMSALQKKVIGKRIGSFHIYADISQDFKKDDKIPADFIISVKLRRPCIWDDSDYPDADDESEDGASYNILKKPEFK